MIRAPEKSILMRAASISPCAMVLMFLEIASFMALVGSSPVGGSNTAATRNRLEIRQLAAAIDAFKAYFKVDYIPSRIYLSESGEGYVNTIAGTLPAESIAYLKRLWPKLSPPFTSLPGGGIDWNGSGRIEGVIVTPGTENPGGEMLLEGDQCLVFFLGGIPSQGIDLATGDPGVPACNGFSTNPINPAAHLLPGGGPSKPPFYEFDSSRLVNIVRATKPHSPRMLSYLDTFGTSDGKGNLVSGMPYAYFSSYGIRNGYEHQAGVSDCATLRVFPYAESVNAQGHIQYLNPLGCQIISAGADRKFGSGSAFTSTPRPFWTSGTAAHSEASGPNGADDQSNFYDRLLGESSDN